MCRLPYRIALLVLVIFLVGCYAGYAVDGDDDDNDMILVPADDDTATDEDNAGDDDGEDEEEDGIWDDEGAEDDDGDDDHTDDDIDDDDEDSCDQEGFTRCNNKAFFDCGIGCNPACTPIADQCERDSCHWGCEAQRYSDYLICEIVFNCPFDGTGDLCLATCFQNGVNCLKPLITCNNYRWNVCRENLLICYNWCFIR